MTTVEDIKNEASRLRMERAKVEQAYAESANKVEKMILSMKDHLTPEGAKIFAEMESYIRSEVQPRQEAAKKIMGDLESLGKRAAALIGDKNNDIHVF